MNPSMFPLSPNPSRHDEAFPQRPARLSRCARRLVPLAVSWIACGAGATPITGVLVSQEYTEHWFDGTAYDPAQYGKVETGLLSQSSVSIRTISPHATATAYSAANLPAGTLRATASSGTPILPDGTPGLHHSSAFARAGFSDVLTLHGDFSEPVYGTFRIHLDGTMTISQGALYGTTVIPAPRLTEPQAYMSLYFFSSGAPALQYESLLSDVAGTRFIDETFEVQVPLHLQAVDSLGVRRLTLDAQLTAFSNDGGWVDLGNTARFSLELPQGYSFTSEQGFGTVGVPDAGPGRFLVAGTLLFVAAWGSRNQRTRLSRTSAGTGIEG